MIEKIGELPPGCEGLRAQGKVTREDYQQVFEPLLEQAHREGRRIRLLYHFGPGFEGLTAGAAWEDMRMGLHYLRLFERCAVVSDITWIREASRAVGAMMAFPVKVFANNEWDLALSWLSSSVRTSGLKHRLLSDLGVLLVEPQGPLQAEDFEALALTVDPWIEAQGSLHGLVVHTHHFPGWENLGALLGHLRFVREHHRKVQRVALVADGKIAELGPRFAEHFVQAELKHFNFDRLDEAIAWASAPAALPTVRSAT